MKGLLVVLIVLGINGFHVQPARANEPDAITQSAAEITKSADVASVRTTRGLQLLAEDNDGSCTEERNACFDDSSCTSCFEAADDTDCLTDSLDCGELQASYCCAVGGSDDLSCHNNTLIVDLVECETYDVCDFGDDLCSGARSTFSCHTAGSAVVAAAAAGVLGLLVSGLSVVAA